MCNLHDVTPKGDFERYVRKINKVVTLPDYSLRPVGPMDTGLFIRPDNGDLRGYLGRWAMVKPGSSPAQVAAQRHLTNNARVETVGELPTYRAAWRNSQRCLIPANWLREPNWESGRCIWWNLRRYDGDPWMIGGIWNEWVNADTGEVVPNYAMVTFNVNDHPFLNRLHKPEVDPVTKKVLPPELQDKRGEAHIHPDDWDTWLYGTPEEALRLLVPPPVEMFDQSDAVLTDLAVAQMADEAPRQPDLW